MRPIVTMIATLTVCFAVTAADLLDASRAAVVGSQPPIRSLRMSGRLRMAGRGDETIDGTLELRAQLPRRFLRVDTIGSARRVSGFDGNRLLTTSNGRGTSGLADERAAFARMMLGIAAIVATDEPARIEAGGEEAFPDTRSVDITTKSWSLRFVMDATSAMPMRLVFFGKARGTTITSFADRRDVAGYQIPHRITTTTADRVLETLMFDEVIVNPPFGDADFRP